MAVPDTNTFSQRDVVTEIYGNSSNRSLTELFAAANGTFDSRYVGSKNSLYNFRNYQHEVWSMYQSIAGLGINNVNYITYTCTWRMSSHVNTATYGMSVYSLDDPTYFVEKYYQAGTFANEASEITLPNLNVTMYPAFTSGKTYHFSSTIMYNGKQYYYTGSNVTVVCP